MPKYLEEVIPNVTTFTELVGADVAINGNKRFYSFKERARYQLPGKDVFRPLVTIGLTVKNADLDFEFPSYNPNTGDPIAGKVYSWRDLEKAIYSAYRYVASLRDAGTLPE